MIRLAWSGIVTLRDGRNDRPLARLHRFADYKPERVAAHLHLSKAIVRRPERWDQFETFKTGLLMSMLISVLITFVVIILVLYLINMLPLDGRAKQIVRVIVIIIGILSLLKYLTVF
jgi:hypothetical protein